MITYVLIFLIATSGLIMIAGGIWGLVYLLGQETRSPLRYYAAVVGMICGGLAMWALAQVLRIELAIFVLENAHR
jgi:DMSO reductase anchor subunit